jgi:uncharacterized protein (TIGR03435 family)
VFDAAAKNAASGQQSSGPGASDPNGTLSVFESIDKQLGLKLAVQKHPMPVVVVDHAKHAPTEND